MEPIDERDLAKLEAELRKDEHSHRRRHSIELKDCQYPEKLPPPPKPYIIRELFLFGYI